MSKFWRSVTLKSDLIYRETVGGYIIKTPRGLISISKKYVNVIDSEKIEIGFSTTFIFTLFCEAKKTKKTEITGEELYKCLTEN